MALIRLSSPHVYKANSTANVMRLILLATVPGLLQLGRALPRTVELVVGSRASHRLRSAGVVEARREGTWMHYRISEDLPGWARRLVAGTLDCDEATGISRCRRRLEQMAGRPEERACG